MKKNSLRSLLPFVIAFALLIVLSLSPGPWVGASPLGDTAPRPTPSATHTALPGAPTATATETPEMPTPSADATPTETPTETPTDVPSSGSPTETPTSALPPAQPPAQPTGPSAPPVATATTGAVPTATVVAPPPGSTVPVPSTGQPTPGAAATLPTSRATPAGRPQTTEPLPSTSLPITDAVSGSLLDPGAPLTLDIGTAAHVAFPAGAVGSPLRLVFEPVDPALLPAPPDGYRFGKQAVRVRVLPGAASLPVDSFLQPFKLTLDYSQEAAPTGGPSGFVVGYLGTTSDAWAALVANDDPASQSMIAEARWPGTYAILIRTSQPASVTVERAAGSMLPVAALTGFLTLLAGVLLWRVRAR